MSEEKTKPPTEKRLRDAHRDGESAKSHDLTAAAALLFSGLMLWLGADFFGDRLRRLFAIVWLTMPQRDGGIAAPLLAMATELAMLTLPLALAALLGATLGLVAQGAATMSMKPLEPKFDKVNPFNGMKELFSLRTAIDGTMMLLKALLFSILLWQTILALLPLLVRASARPPEVLPGVLWQAFLRMLFVAVAAFAVCGLADYGLQRFIFRRQHRMSEDEIRREHKDEEGDAEVKSRRKEMAQELVLDDPREAVAGASLLVANPTHYAVALLHRRGEVPLVVAKGVDGVALALRAHAEASGVPVVVDPPLARTLYRVPLGSGIPRHCFEIVATLLHTVAALRRLAPSESGRAA